MLRRRRLVGLLSKRGQIEYYSADCDCGVLLPPPLCALLLSRLFLDRSLQRSLGRRPTFYEYFASLLSRQWCHVS